MTSRIMKLIKDPVGVVKRRLRWEARMYRTPDGYDAERYWRDRHREYGMDLRGAGNSNLSREENERMYSDAKRIFLSLCNDLGIDLAEARVLEIGCGSGFYTRTLSAAGVRDYTGVDITDALFPDLMQSFPDFGFHKLDVTEQHLDRDYDLIIMIDVTQHITNDDKFSFAMQNIRSHLRESGVFLVTSWLDAGTRESFFEKSRSMEAYEREFPGFSIGEPKRFRDKFVFSIRS